MSVLKEQLNEYLRLQTELAGETDIVRYAESNGSEPFTFTEGAVTPFVINIVEDRVFRNPDQYGGIINQGIRTQSNPEIRIELLVLYVAKFSDYDQSLKWLSHVIRFFQSHRIFTPENSPVLSDEGIEKLIVEFVSLPLEEQNQVWHSLHTTYSPSVLYRIRLFQYLDENSVELAGEQITNTELQTLKNISQ